MLRLTLCDGKAMLGLDDVRDIQARGGDPTRVFLNEETYATCSRVFPYLVRKVEPNVERRVASIDWHVVPNEFEKFYPMPGVDLSFTRECFTPVSDT